MPRYDLADPVKQQLAHKYLDTLVERKATVDVIKVIHRRSLSQNAYYHKMLSYFGTQVGSTLEECKALIRELQTDLYHTHDKTIGNVTVRSSRSSADFNSAEMTRSIDDFRTWAREVASVDIPAPDDTELLRYMDEIIAQNAQYL